MYTTCENYKSKHWLCLIWRIYGQRDKTESEALTFEIQSQITPDMCSYEKSMVHSSFFFRDSDDLLAVLGFSGK